MSVFNICLRCQAHLLLRRTAATQLSGRRFESSVQSQPIENPHEFVSLSHHGLTPEASRSSETTKRPNKNTSSPSRPNRLETLFQSNVPRGRDSPVPLSRYSRVPLDSILLETDAENDINGNAKKEIFERMKRISESDALSSEMWSVWLELDARKLRKEELEENREVLEKMFRYMVGNRVKKQYIDRKGPKVAQVLSLFQQWGMVHLQLLEGEIRLVLTRLSSSDLLYERELNAQKKASLSYLLSDLLLLWRYHFFHTANRAHPSPDVDEGFKQDGKSWIGLPSLADVTKALEAVKARYLWRYKRVFATRDEENAKFLSSAASLTHLLLYAASSRKIMSATTSTVARPFLDVFSFLALGANREYTLINYCLPLNRKENRLQELLMAWWHKMLNDLETNIIPKQSAPVQESTYEASFEELAIPLGIPELASSQSGNTEPGSDNHRLKQSNKLNTLSMDIRKAATQQNIKALSYLWQRFVAEMRNPKTRQNEPLHSIYAEFLWGFVSTSRLEEVTKVWESMKLYNVTPSLVHWNALLEFALKTRIRGAASKVWQQMTQDAQVRPDNQSWTIYLTALMRDGRWREALSEIAELGKAWTRETNADALESSGPASGDAEFSTKEDRKHFLPSMMPVNAVLTGLFILQQTNATKVVINWSRTHGLKANVTTYNIFLRSASRKGDRKALMALIDEMRTNGIQADATTLTMLLHGLIRGKTSVFDDLSPEEQEALISRELDAMHASGIPANEHTYSTLLAALVSTPEPNLAGARVLLGRLSASKTKVPSHIYTTLIRYYFSTDPPNLLAVENLWSGIEKAQGTLDHVGYDRLVEGWAQVGNLEKVLFFLRRLTNEGNVPGWLALHRALEAMIKERDWELCEQLVYDVERRDGLLRVGERGWRGEEDFWELVGELRRRELIPKRENMGYVRKRDRTRREKFKDVAHWALKEGEDLEEREAERVTQSRDKSKEETSQSHVAIADMVT